MSNGTVILGIDPGLAHFGYSVVHLQRDSETILQLGVFKTEPSKSKTMAKTEDLFVRSVSMAKKLEWLISNYHVVMICAERFSYPPQSSNAVKMAVSWGIIGSIAARRDITLIMKSPQEIKKKICGKNSASKEDVENTVVARYPQSKYAFDSFYRAYKKEDREHAFDATAAAVACLDTDIITTLRLTL